MGRGSFVGRKWSDFSGIDIFVERLSVLEMLIN